MRNLPASAKPVETVDQSVVPLLTRRNGDVVEEARGSSGPAQESRADMLTNKGKYGLKALVYLASLPAGETAFILDIATRNNIPKKFLDTILLDLRKAGILRSKKGPGGGYALSKSPDEIHIGQVIRVLDGPLAPIRCASRTAYEACDDCPDPAACHVRRSMTKVRDAMAAILDTMTLSEMARIEEGAMETVVKVAS